MQGAKAPFLANIGTLQPALWYHPLFRLRNNCTPDFLLKNWAAAYREKKGTKIRNLSIIGWKFSVLHILSFLAKLKLDLKNCKQSRLSGCKCKKESHLTNFWTVRGPSTWYCQMRNWLSPQKSRFMSTANNDENTSIQRRVWWNEDFTTLHAQKHQHK